MRTSLIFWYAIGIGSIITWLGGLISQAGLFSSKEMVVVVGIVWIVANSNITRLELLNAINNPNRLTKDSNEPD